MMNTALHNRAVAVKMGVSKDTVQNDIRMAVNEMLVLCFGLPAARSNPKTYQNGGKGTAAQLSADKSGWKHS